MACGRIYLSFGKALCVLALSGLSLFANEKPDSPEPKFQVPSQSPTPPAASQTGTQADTKDGHAKDEVPKRIFWIIPNFMTTNDQPENQGPLTPKQKFNIAWHQFFDESAHFGNLLAGGDFSGGGRDSALWRRLGCLRRKIPGSGGRSIHGKLLDLWNSADRAAR